MVRKIRTIQKHWRRSLLALAAFALAWAQPAAAWNAAGHKATARIAFELLSTEQRQEVSRILLTHPRFKEDFQAAMPRHIRNRSASAQALWVIQQASIWPDIVAIQDGRTRARFHRVTWHYINLPVYLTAADEKNLAGQLTQNMSLEFSPPLRQNLNVVQALRGNLAVWADQQATDAEKAVALCWILHLIGDLHQPLHNVALFSSAYFPKGDRGGNSVKVWHADGPTNMHAAWDGLPSDFADLEPGVLTADKLRTDNVRNHSIDFWLRRHHQLAKVFIYTDDVKDQLLNGLQKQEYPAIRLSDYYLDNARLLAKEQVILAGHRIAAMIAEPGK